MFSVTESNGKVHEFAGIRNLCETEKSALKRAWWRAKWISDGTFYDYYK